MNNSIALIIVNFNGGHHLVRCLEAVKKQTCPPHTCIVVDNASEMAPLTGDEHYLNGIKLVRLESNLGFAAANNLAVKLCEPRIKWIALLNPDAYPEPEWLENLIRAALSRPDVSSFASRQIDATNVELLDGAGDGLTTGGRPFRRGFGSAAHEAFLQEDYPFSACGASALYNRDVFLSSGGFDEDFFCYLEDIDLGFRMRLYGHTCLYVPTAIVRHHGSALTGQRSDFSTYHGHRNIVWVYVKNMPTPLLFMNLPTHLFLTIAGLLVCSLRGQGKVFIKAKLDAVKKLRIMLYKRHIIQNKRTSETQLINSSLTSERLSLRRLIQWL